MIVDDDSLNVYSMQLLINSIKKSEIFSASNGKEAVEKVENFYIKEKRTYDIIIMDINMPLLNGIEATK